MQSHGSHQAVKEAANCELVFIPHTHTHTHRPRLCTHSAHTHILSPDTHLYRQRERRRTHAVKPMVVKGLKRGFRGHEVFGKRDGRNGTDGPFGQRIRQTVKLTLQIGFSGVCFTREKGLMILSREVHVVVRQRILFRLALEAIVFTSSNQGHGISPYFAFCANVRTQRNQSINERMRVRGELTAGHLSLPLESPRETHSAPDSHTHRGGNAFTHTHIDSRT